MLVHWPRHITLSEARSRLYQRRSWPPNSHFSAFFKIYKIFTILRRSNLEIFENFINIFVILKKNNKILQIIFKIFDKFLENLDNFLQKFEFRAVQKCANLVDLEKCCKMTIWWPKSALIQPRTSLGKSDVSWGARTRLLARCQQRRKESKLSFYAHVSGSGRGFVE